MLFLQIHVYTSIQKQAFSLGLQNKQVFLDEF